MLKYLGYKAIVGLASVLPRGGQYQIAHRVADLNYLLDHNARQAVKENVRVILGADAPEAGAVRADGSGDRRVRPGGGQATAG